MSRVPDVPLRVTTFAQFLRHGYSITAHWGCGHEEVLDLKSLVATHGPQAQPDYNFKSKLVCPHCGRVGAGTIVSAG
jgi:hypothetical protein